MANKRKIKSMVEDEFRALWVQKDKMDFPQRIQLLSLGVKYMLADAKLLEQEEGAAFDQPGDSTDE